MYSCMHSNNNMILLSYNCYCLSHTFVNLLDKTVLFACGFLPERFSVCLSSSFSRATLLR